jgi:hypothetical protein
MGIRVKQPVRENLLEHRVGTSTGNELRVQIRSFARIAAKCRQQPLAGDPVRPQVKCVHDIDETVLDEHACDLGEPAHVRDSWPATPLEFPVWRGFRRDDAGPHTTPIKRRGRGWQPLPRSHT